MNKNLLQQSIRSERGQAMVLIVLAIVAMVGFMGLAIDGGRVYSERRTAQNAADAAAYAAAMAAVAGQDPFEAGLDQAAANNYLDSDESANSGQPVDVIVNNPPQSGSYAGNSEYYEVIIRTSVDSSFMKMIAINELAVQATSVVHARGIDSISAGNVVHALNLDGNGIEFKGNVNVYVEGGNIMSNSAIDQDGGSGDILVEGGGILYVDGDTDKWKGSVSPTPVKVPNPMFVAQVPQPDCGTIYREIPRSNQGKKIYSPGIYQNRLMINAHDDIVFEPGIYCFMDGIHDNGNSTATGNGVTFFLMGGDLQFNGSSEVKLVRPNDLTDPSGNQWGGMLLYVPPSNADAVIDITGNNETLFSGTILAPEGYCRIGGTSQDLGVDANIICHDILFHGTPDVHINYVTNQNFRVAPAIELSE